MSTPAPQQLLQVDDLYRLPDDHRKHELEAGVLVSEPLPSPRHGRIAMEIGARLHAHVRRNALGIVVGNDSAFLLARSPDTVRGPDVAFVSRERAQDAGEMTTAFPGAPDLAIEVLSPGTAPGAVRAKVAEYLTAGARRVWVLDAERETVTVYGNLLAPRVLSAADTLDGEDVVPGFEVRVRELFGR